MSEYERKVLNALAWFGGFTTGQVAERVSPMFGGNKRQHSAAVRSWLLGLEKKGLVKRLDDQKPVCWTRATKATHEPNQPGNGAGTVEGRQ